MQVEGAKAHAERYARIAGLETDIIAHQSTAAHFTALKTAAEEVENAAKSTHNAAWDGTCVRVHIPAGS